MTLMEGLIAMGVMLAIGGIVFAKAASNNPKLLEFLGKVMPTSLYTKPDIKIIPDNVQQVWDERRSML